MTNPHPSAAPDAGAPQERPELNHSEEELTPHMFIARSGYSGVWCRDCEYHKDHAIHVAPAAHQERTERPRDHYTWGEAMEQFAALGIGPEAWAELMELEQRGAKARNNDRSGMSISWRTFRLVLAVLRAIRIEDFINARNPRGDQRDDLVANDDLCRCVEGPLFSGLLKPALERYLRCLRCNRCAAVNPK